MRALRSQRCRSSSPRRKAATPRALAASPASTAAAPGHLLRGPGPPWPVPLAQGLTCKITSDAHQNPYLLSSWPITPNKSGRLRDSKKSSGGGKGLCLCCRSRALTSGATKPPGRRGCDDLSGAGPMHLKARRAVSFLPCCISCHATLDLQQKHRVLLLQGTVARAEAYHGGEQTARRPNQGPTPRIPKKEDGVKGLPQTRKDRPFHPLSPAR